MSLFSAGLFGPDIPDSGIARLTFDDADTDSGTAIDSWNNNDATINGATTGVSGANQTYITNEAYSFDGSNDYVKTPINLDNYSIPITIAVWVNIDDVSVTQGIVADYNNSSNRLTFGTINSSFDFFLDGTAVTASASSNTWTHLVGVIGSSDLILYKDGSQAGSGGFSGSMGSGDDLEIARRPRNGGESYFSGIIDDPRFYDKELTSTEVSNLYNTGSI